MANQTFHACGFANSLHRNGKCPTGEAPTKVLPAAEQRYSSLLLVSATLAEENDKLKVRLGKAMAETVLALTAVSRNRSLAHSRRALAFMRGVGET